MDNNSKRTAPLNQPLKRFRNPSNRVKSSSSATKTVQLFFPNGQIIPIPTTATVTLGRGAATLNRGYKIDLDDIPGATDGVSRQHAILTMIDGILHIKDYNSTNGTYIDKTELYPMRNYVLEDGDIVTLGKVQIKVRFFVSDNV